MHPKQVLTAVVNRCIAEGSPVFTEMPKPPPFDFAEVLQARVRDLEAALEIATAQVRDLAYGWPTRELLEPPSDTIARLYRLLPDSDIPQL